jgi:hypothetical protein
MMGTIQNNLGLHDPLISQMLFGKENDIRFLEILILPP